MEQTREEFLAERRKGIGGSDWSSVLNLKPWGCARKLMYEKLNTPPDYAEEEHGYLQRGNELEPLVAERAAKDFGVRLRRPGTLPKGVAPFWWAGNPDRVVVPDGVWEGKTIEPIRFRKVKKMGIPADHTLQVQHYIKRADRLYGLYTALEPLSWEFYHANLKRDDELLAKMEAAGAQFWKCRQQERFPTWVDPDTGLATQRLDAGDARCRRCSWRWTCQGAALFDTLPEAAEGELQTLDSPELAELVAERDALDTVLKEAKELKDGNSKQIRAILETPRKVLTTTGRPVYWLQYARTSIDSKRLKKEEPLIAEKYTKQSAVNSLRVY